MSLHSKIAAFLRSRLADSYRDDCIAKEIGDTTLAEVREETERMRWQLEFLSGGICGRCQDLKPATTMALLAPSRLPT